MTAGPEHISGITTHARRGSIRNAFRYGIDYVLIDPEQARGPLLFSRNRFNLTSVHDQEHGGPRGNGQGVGWARRVLTAHGYTPKPTTRILLLTQPSFLGYIFNPVSFWLVMETTGLCAVIAEVNNTYGDRHSYLCHRPGFTPISPDDQIIAEKVFHVSPFQDIAGEYAFNFDICPDRINIRILHRNGSDGVIATLQGRRKPLTNRSILGAVLRRPCGALRTIALIHWQALRLKFKGARYRTRPGPPSKEVT